VQQLQLASQKRRVVYVQSYTTSKVISKVLNCAFYKAKANDKGKVLQEWIKGSRG
jgi:hypothetical protein